MPLDETELYEMAVPGKFVGKEIIDAEARRIGLCHSIRIKTGLDKKGALRTDLFIVIKGHDVEFDISFNDIEKIGNVIKLKVPAHQADEIQVKDAIRIQEDIAGEIRSRASKI